ncbi:hypothetical protein [Paenibacillus macerans]|uniref:hypothetical protein n=1 Tax=Paenibacillus macerans TaxID=44252 RepID=UPI003D315AE8
MVYDEEVTAEMECRHSSWLKLLNESAERLETCLLEQPVPQNMPAYAYMHGLTRFHKSMLALRLLAVAGFEEEAYGAWRRMVEHAVMLKYIARGAGERVLLFVDETGFIRPTPAGSSCGAVPDMGKMAEEAGMREWYEAAPPNGSEGDSSFTPTAGDSEDWFPPIGPAPFDASDLLSKGYRLAAVMLEDATFSVPSRK